MTLQEPAYLKERALRTGRSSGTWIQGNDGRWWYRHSDGSYTKNGWEFIDGHWYYFDGEGWMVTGWREIGGKWYYFKDTGAMGIGWLKYNGAWYYLQSSGAMAIGWLEIDGKWYHFRSSGAMELGWYQYKNQWYYFQSNGAMAVGWLQIDDSWYYFNGSGAMVTGWQKINGEWYYFHENGKMVPGFLIEDDILHFFENGAWDGMTLAGLDRETQLKTNWCWAACASMVGNYKKSPHVGQYAIVRHIYGDSNNYLGNLATWAKGTRYASGGRKKAYGMTRTLTFDEIKNSIDAHKPFVIVLRGSGRIGHMIVGSGYRKKEKKIWVVDPWENTKSGYVRYDLIKIGKDRKYPGKEYYIGGKY